METEQRNALRKNHVALVDHLDPCDIIDDLFEDGILTENDCDHIKSCNSRKDKCRLLLKLLPTRGGCAYGSFVKSLTAGYGHLVPLLQCSKQDTDNDSIQTKEGGGRGSGNMVKVCNHCKPLIPPFALPALEKLIKQNCCLILRNVEPNDLLDLHYQEFVLGSEECERIKTGKTRLERCTMFVSELSRCNNDTTTSVFMKSLERKYRYIVDELSKCTQSTIETLSTPLLTDTPRPILAAVLRMSIKANMDYPMKNVRLRQTNAPHHKGNQVTDISIDSEVNKTEDKPLNDWVIRRSRHLKQERRLSDKMSRHDQMFSCFEDNIADNMLVLPSSMDNLVEPNTTDQQRYTFESVLKANLGPTKSSLVQNENNEPGRSKVLSVNKDSAHCNESDTLRANTLSPKADRRFQRKGKPSVGTKHATNPYLYRDNSSKNKDANEAQKQRSEKRQDLSTGCNLSPVASFPGSATSHDRRSIRLEVAFNSLSTMINQGEFQKFDMYAMSIQVKYSEDSDMMCILDYLHASRDLFVTDIHSAKKHINTGLQRVARTSNPKYFTLELFSAQTRMYIAQRKLNKLENTLADAKMIIETDPVGCSGRAAGWLFMNDVRDISSQLAVLNARRPNYPSVYKYLHEKAVKSCRKALDNFSRDGGKDGPFGIGFALCRLAILLLRCGDNGLTMEIQRPDSEDIELASNYLQQLENSKIPIPKILEVHSLLAKSDLQYRRSNSVRALEHAEAAYQLAKDINMLEFSEHAHNRVVYLNNLPVSVDVVNEEEVSRILFDDLAESDAYD